MRAKLVADSWLRIPKSINWKSVAARRARTPPETDIIIVLHAHIDGGARGNPGPAAIGVVIHDDQGNLLFEEGTYIGHATNNEAEYRALIRLLEVCATDPVIKNSGASILRVACDSLLIVNQVLGEWKIKEPRLQELNSEVQRKKALLNGLTPRIRHVRREENKVADTLVNRALDKIEKSIK